MHNILIKRFIQTTESVAEFEDMVNQFITDPTIEVVRMNTFTDGIDVMYRKIPTIDMDNYYTKHNVKVTVPRFK